MRKVLYIAIALLLALSCGPRKIPREKMEAILADMLVQDQQIKHDRALKRQADTSLVYEGIFEAYGYDTDDFLYSVEVYLQDPAKVEKMMEKVGERLDGQAKLAKEELRIQTWRESLLRVYYDHPDTTVIPQPGGVPVTDTLTIRFKEGKIVSEFPSE